MEISNNIKKDIPYISVKACPVCGEHPELQKESLARPGGGGYPGYYTYQYKCGFCRLLKGIETNDIYDDFPEEAKNRAKTYWNEEVDRVHKIQQAYAATRSICD